MVKINQSSHGVRGAVKKSAVLQSLLSLFMFDNSQNHRALPPDALRASVLNFKDGGKTIVNQRAGWYIDEH